MNADQPPQNGDQSIQVKTCAKLARSFAAGRIDPFVYSDNILLRMVDDPESVWDECLDTIPKNFLPAFFDHMREHYELVDFMPHPGYFLHVADSESESNDIKQRFRPRYIKIFEMVKSRL